MTSCTRFAFSPQIPTSYSYNQYGALLLQLLRYVIETHSAPTLISFAAATQAFDPASEAYGHGNNKNR